MIVFKIPEEIFNARRGVAPCPVGWPRSNPNPYAV